MTRFRATTRWDRRRPSALCRAPRFGGLPIGLALLLPALLGISDAVAHAQALPVATSNPVSTGFEIPKVGGSLSYAISANESFSSGFYSSSGFQAYTGLSGDVALVTASKSAPFSMVLATGRSWSSSGQPSPFYLNFSASQVVNWKRWNAVFADSVGYFPATPSVGLSGIPGTGDLGIPPIQIGFDTGQGLLTSYSTRLSNTASVNVGRRVTAKSSASLFGSYGILRFVGNSAGNGLESDSYSAGASYSYALSALSSLSTNYSYSNYKYSGGLSGYQGQTVNLGYSRQFSRRLSGGIFAGPQWTTIQSKVSLVPGTPPYNGTSLNLFVSGNLAYSTKTVGYSLSYSRGTNGGYGALPGGQSDAVSFSASKTFDRVWNAALTSAYTRTTSLQNFQSFAGTTFVVGGQVSRALGRNLSAFGSYTLEKQTSKGSNIGVFNLFTGSFQVASFGVSYSPRLIRFGAH